MAGAELAKVDPADEPSAEWGWHGEFPKATTIAGILTAIALPLMLIGHHVSWTELLFSCVPSLFILAGVVWLNVRKRRDWRQ